MDQFGAPLDSDIKRFQPLDQQPLVPVLRKDLQEGVGRQAEADGFKRKTRCRFAFRPKIDGGNLVAPGDYGLCEVKLPVEFERAGLNRQSARGGSWLGGLVNDPYLDAELCQPKRQHQPRRTCTNDQNISPRHLLCSNPSFIAPAYKARNPRETPCGIENGPGATCSKPRPRLLPECCSLSRS